MRFFLSVIDKISEWSGKIFSFIMLTATLLVTYGVIMRYAFNRPTVVELEITVYMCAATYTIGGASAMLTDAHVRVDALYSRWSPRTKALVNLIGAPVLFAGLAALLWAGADWTIEAIKMNTKATSFLEPIIWPVRLLIPLSSLLLILQGLAQSIRDFRAGTEGVRHEH